MTRTGPFIVSYGFWLTDGPIWGGWHCLRTVPYKFERTDGSIQGDRDCSRSVPCRIGWTDGPVRGGRQGQNWPAHRVMWTNGSIGRMLRFRVDGTVWTAHTTCLVGAGGRTDGLVRGGWHGQDCATRAMPCRFVRDGQSSSGRVAWLRQPHALCRGGSGIWTVQFGADGTA